MMVRATVRTLPILPATPAQPAGPHAAPTTLVPMEALEMPPLVQALPVMAIRFASWMDTSASSRPVYALTNLPVRPAHVPSSPTPARPTMIRCADAMG